MHRRIPVSAAGLPSMLFGFVGFANLVFTGAAGRGWRLMTCRRFCNTTTSGTAAASSTSATHV